MRQSNVNDGRPSGFFSADKAALMGLIALLAAALMGQPVPRSAPGGRGPRRPAGKALEVGQDAPDFTLDRLEAFHTGPAGTSLPSAAAGKVSLSSFRGKKPVCLVFTSYT